MYACLSVCLSQVRVLQRWLNNRSRKQRRTIAQRSTAITSRLRSSQTFPKVHTRAPPPAALLFLHPIRSQPLSVNLVALLFCRPITSQFYYYPQHYFPCIFCIFISNVSHSFHLSSYSFIIVLIYVAYCVYCCFYHCIEYLYSPNKYGRRVNNKNTIKTTQLQIRQKKHLKLDSNLNTRLAHNTLGRAKPKYSWQYFTISIFLVVKSFMKKLLITKSRDWRSDSVKGHASRPYSSAGKHLYYVLIYSAAKLPVCLQ